MSDSKFKKHTIVFTVLTDGRDLSDHDLGEIYRETIGGDAVGDYSIEVEDIDAKQMVDELYRARSTPECFNLDDDGNELEED